MCIQSLEIGHPDLVCFFHTVGFFLHALTNYAKIPDSACVGAAVAYHNEYQLYVGSEIGFIAKIPVVSIPAIDGQKIRDALPNDQLLSVDYDMPSLSFKNGTSQATPYVTAAAAAVIKQLKPVCSTRQIRSALEDSATRLNGDFRLVGNGFPVG